jgi:ribonuclease P/MRP protein subunit RPP40
MEENNLLPDGQHGFRSKRSCLTQLLSYWDSVLDQMEEGKGVDAVYTDFAKAFDKCETGVLLHRLKECGVRGKMGHWLAAFLDPSVRMQSVGVDGRLSTLASVVSGVPQGTVLGPCLFLIHLMGISTNLSAGTTASSFADDTRLLRGITDEDDCEVLQEDLDQIYSWAEDIGMQFNAGKFELVRFWLDHDKAPDILYMAPDGGPIEEKDSLRDLGVRISSDLSFSMQIDLTVNSGSRMAGWALRTFRGSGKHLMLTLLRSLIQPRLDYCSQLWSPRDQSSINRLEDVQRQFLSQIWDPVLVKMSYWEKLSHLRVYSQERRRERYQICFLWKLTQGLVEGYSIKWQWSDRRGRLAIPNNIPRAAPTKVKQARERSLGVHGAHLFNLLPIKLRNEDSGDFALFKNHLDIFLSVIPDQPTTPGLARAAVSNSLLEQVPLVQNLYES